MSPHGLLGWAFGRRARVRLCTECGTTWTMPRHVGNSTPRNKGVAAVGELYSAARLLSKQFTAGAQEEAEVRDALAHCPQCGSGQFAEFREQR